MSRALTLIAFYVSNLLVLSHFLTLFTEIRFVGSQELYSPYSDKQQLSGNLGGLIDGPNSSSGGVEIDNNGQQFGENGGNNGASTQSSQSLQLILTKLFPTLKHWSKNSQFEETPPRSVSTGADQSGFIATTGQIGEPNELQDQSSAIQPTDLNYVIAANHNNNNNNNNNRDQHYQQQQMIQQNLNETSTNANANSPIRQLISAHSNALFYPPTEQPYKIHQQQQQYQQNQQQQPQQQLQQIQQLPLLAPQNNNLANAHYSDHLALQTQQSFLPNHLQSIESTKPSLYHYTATPPSHHFSVAAQAQSFPSPSSRPTTTNIIEPNTNLLQLASLPISSNSNVQQPYYSSFKPFSLEQLQHQRHQQQQQQTPEPSQPQNSSHLSSMLAFLANNRANLSNLIQLLPLIAQTISILPRVFPISKSSFSATPTGTELSSPKNYHESSSPSKSNQPSSSSILSLIQSSTSPSSKNSNATENLTERFQHSTSTTDSSNQSQVSQSNDSQVSSINSSNNRLQSLLNNPIWTQILPHLAKQFISTSLNQYSTQPSSQYEFAGVNRPDISYSFADSATSSLPSSSSPIQPSSLNWIKSFVTTLASSAQKQQQQQSQEQQRPFDRNTWQNSSPQTNHPSGLGFNLDSIPSANTFLTSPGWLNNIRPVSQVLESWLLNRVNSKR